MGGGRGYKLEIYKIIARLMYIVQKCLKKILFCLKFSVAGFATGALQSHYRMRALPSSPTLPHLTITPVAGGGAGGDAEDLVQGKCSCVALL